MADRNLWKKTGLMAAMLMSTAAAQAEPAVQLKAVAPPPDIVITGRAEPTASEVQQQARAVSRMGDYYHDPLARFSEPVCPGVLGLPADAAGIVVDRIRYNAERVGAPVAPTTDCKANIVVAFTRDGGAQVRKLLKTKGFLFNGLETPEARELQDETGPVRAWNVTALHNRHGQDESPSFEAGPVRFENGSFTPTAPVRIVMVPTSDSHLFLASRIDITASVVIIDLGAIDGMPAAQIADYAAMRALARTRPAQGDSAATTILSLFDPAVQHPREMTAFDLAYLRSLYDAGSNVPASVKILGVNRALRKDGAEAMKVSTPLQ